MANPNTPLLYDIGRLAAVQIFAAKPVGVTLHHWLKHGDWDRSFLSNDDVHRGFWDRVAEGFQLRQEDS